jgi:hypothetical protein
MWVVYTKIEVGKLKKSSPDIISEPAVKLQASYETLLEPFIPSGCLGTFGRLLMYLSK